MGDAEAPQLETPAGEQDGVRVGWGEQGQAATACVRPCSSPALKLEQPFCAKF